MSRRHHTVGIACLVLLAALALTAPSAPVALAGRATTCLARNATQGTSSTSFRVVVTLAHDGDRLEVRGTCRTRGIEIDKDLVIRGMGDRATLTGQHRYRVLRIARGAVVTLRHLVITRGVPRSGDFFAMGGGITNRGTLTVVDSLVTHNEGDLESEDYVNMPYSGGGIYNIGTLTLIRSTVSGHGDGDTNIQGGGGGILNVGTATLIDSVVTDNHTDYWGGGISNSGTMTLRRSTVSDNGVRWGLFVPVGGGIDNSGALTLIESRVTGNHGYNGGGIGNAGTVRLRDSTVTANTASDRGGGIFNSRRGTVILTGGSSVTGNSAGGPASDYGEVSGVGGGIFNRGTLTLRDSTVTGNQAGVRGGGIFNSRRGTVILRGSASVTDNTPDDCVGTPAC